VNESTSCTVCRRDLWEDELGRYACKPCQRRIDDHLRDLAGPYGLYARLCLRMEPGARSNGPRVSGSSAAPIPVSLDVLDMTSDGGVVSVLEDWVEDWSTYGLGIQGAAGRLQHRVDQAIGTLRRNLPQAALRHPALAAFASEIHLIRRRCETHVDGERVAHFKVTCGCGWPIRFAVDTPGITCPGCAADYGLEEIRQLAEDQRAA
jgi:hypothetical protein